MVKKLVRCVREVVFDVRLRSRSHPNMFVGYHNVENINISPSNRGQIYVKLAPWWSYYRPSRALSVPTPPTSAYGTSRMHALAHDDFENWNLGSCEMCTLVLLAFERAAVCLSWIDSPLISVSDSIPVVSSVSSIAIRLGCLSSFKKRGSYTSLSVRSSFL